MKLKIKFKEEDLIFIRWFRFKKVLDSIYNVRIYKKEIIIKKIKKRFKFLIWKKKMIIFKINY